MKLLIALIALNFAFPAQAYVYVIGKAKAPYRKSSPNRIKTDNVRLK